jgi:diacylglycerol kinase family enzyme
MPKLLLIANPAASGFTGGAYREAVRVLNEAHHLEVVWPQSGVEATEAAAKAAADGYDIVAGMGGDGVLHRVANGIAGTRTALGIIPAGTTDVLARILGIPRDAARAAAVLRDAEPQASPVARYDADGPDGPISGYALFAFGAGLDAEVVQDAETTPHRKTWFGGLYYARRAVGMFFREFRKRRPTLTVTVGEEAWEAVAVLTQVRWPYTYFGPMPLRLTARPAGRLTLGVIETAPIVRAGMLAVTSLFGRGVGRIRGIEVCPDQAGFSVAADPPTLLQADGELLGRASELKVSYRPDFLHIVHP